MSFGKVATNNTRARHCGICTEQPRHQNWLLWVGTAGLTLLTRIHAGAATSVLLIWLPIIPLGGKNSFPDEGGICHQLNWSSIWESLDMMPLWYDVSKIFIYNCSFLKKLAFQTSTMSPFIPLIFTVLASSALGEEGQARILISKQVKEHKIFKSCCYA